MSKEMLRGVGVAVVAVGVGVAAFLGWSGSRWTAVEPLQAKEADTVKRGAYLVSIIGCGDCHTPLKMGAKGPEPDMSRFLSGHPEQMGRLPAAVAQGPWLWAGAATNTAFAGPWGISYAANLTSDRNTGLGIWTEDMFVKAMRTGRHMGVSREILPPMPWTSIRQASDEDLKAMYAYLRTVAPIANHVPDVEPPGRAH